ncbi:MAG TPA: hypothetical protein VGC32_19735, partial [Solirubrobacterales bacterium]
SANSISLVVERPSWVPSRMPRRGSAPPRHPALSSPGECQRGDGVQANPYVSNHTLVERAKEAATEAQRAGGETDRLGAVYGSFGGDNFTTEQYAKLREWLAMKLGEEAAPGGMAGDDFDSALGTVARWAPVMERVQAEGPFRDTDLVAVREVAADWRRLYDSEVADERVEGVDLAAAERDRKIADQILETIDSAIGEKAVA